MKSVFSMALMPFKPEPYAVYEKEIRGRDLFGLFGNESRANGSILQKALPVLQKRIRLIGILLDGNSKAIVEDLNKKQVHFLSKGESIGAVSLKDIRRDKVIFKYNNELIEIEL